MLELLGEDPREGLIKTPERVAKAMQFLTQGYEMNATEILQSAMFSEDYSKWFLLKKLNFTPCANTIFFLFWKSSHSLYPDGNIVGLSKLQESLMLLKKTTSTRTIDQ